MTSPCSWTQLVLVGLLEKAGDENAFLFKQIFFKPVRVEKDALAPEDAVVPPQVGPLAEIPDTDIYVVPPAFNGQQDPADPKKLQLTVPNTGTTFTILKTDDRPRCKECGRTIAEHHSRITEASSGTDGTTSGGDCLSWWWCLPALFRGAGSDARNPLLVSALLLACAGAAVWYGGEGVKLPDVGSNGVWKIIEIVVELISRGLHALAKRWWRNPTAKAQKTQ